MADGEHRSLRQLRVALAAFAFVAAGCRTQSGVGGPCNTANDCFAGLQCVERLCVPMTDAGDANTDGTDLVTSDAHDAIDAMDTPSIDVLDATDVPPIDVPRPMDVHDCGVAPPDAPICATHAVRSFMPGQQVCGALTGPSGVDSSGCQPDTRGPEDVLSFHLGAPGGVSFALDTMLDAVLSLRTDCPPAGTEIGCNEQQVGGLGPALRASLPAGDYEVVIDEFGASGLGGPYVLNTGVYAPAANASCSAAVDLSSGASVMGTIADGDSTSRACRTTDTGSELFYRVTIPAGQQAVLVATPMGPSFRPFLHAFDQCTASPNCLGDATAAMAGSPATLTVHNAGSTDESVIVVVAAQTEPTDPLSAFTLTATIGP